MSLAIAKRFYKDRVQYLNKNMAEYKAFSPKATFVRKLPIVFDEEKTIHYNTVFEDKEMLKYVKRVPTIAGQDFSPFVYATAVLEITTLYVVLMTSGGYSPNQVPLAAIAVETLLFADKKFRRKKTDVLGVSISENEPMFKRLVMMIAKSPLVSTAYMRYAK